MQTIGGLVQPLVDPALADNMLKYLQYQQRFDEVYSQPVEFPDRGSALNFIRQIKKTRPPQWLEDASARAFELALSEIGLKELPRLSRHLAHMNNDQLLRHGEEWAAILANGYRKQGFSASEIAQKAELFKGQDITDTFAYRSRQWKGKSLQPPALEVCVQFANALRGYAEAGHYAYIEFVGSVAHETAHGLQGTVELYPALDRPEQHEYSRISGRQISGVFAIYDAFPSDSLLVRLCSDACGFYTVNERNAYNTELYAMTRLSGIFGLSQKALSNRSSHFAKFLRRHQRVEPENAVL